MHSTKMKDKIMKLGATSNNFLFSILVPLTSLASYLPATPLLSLPLALSFASCTSACFISETINDGLCVQCERWHWGGSIDPRVSRGYQSPSLGPRGVINHRGGSRSDTGTVLSSSGSWHAQWWVFQRGSKRDEWEARLMLSPREREHKRKLMFRLWRKRGGEWGSLCYQEVKGLRLSHFIH